MMKAIIFEGPERLLYTNVADPIPSSGEVRLRVLLTGVCSTDIHILHGRFPVRPPRILGHELVGMVEYVGKNVSEDWLGKICGVQPAWFCGLCQECQQGHPELCVNFQCLGNTHDGGFAEKTIIKVEQLINSTNLPPEALVWLEPLACVMHAIDLCKPLDFKSILIIGAGTMGRLMVQTVHSISSASIAVVDPNPEKINQVYALGAQVGWVIPRKGKTLRVDRQILDWSQAGPQVVIDTTGHPEAIKRALRWAGPAALIILFGVSDPESQMVIPPEIIFKKELNIQAVVGMTPASFQSANNLLQSHRVDPTTQAITYINLDQLPQILTDQSVNKKTKVIVRFQDGIQ